MSETRVDIMTRIVKGELGRGKSLEQVRKEFKERGLILRRWRGGKFIWSKRKRGLPTSTPIGQLPKF